MSGNLAPTLTLILGLLAAWVTIRPPSGKSTPTIWICLFVLLTGIAIVSTYYENRVATAEKDSDTKELKAIEIQTELLYSQNSDLHAQIEQLKSAVNQPQQEQANIVGASPSCVLKSDIQSETAVINRFLHDRLAKSPAYDTHHDYSHDPDYTEKEQSYEVETSREYIQKFWPSIQPLLSRAVAVGVAPEGTSALSTPGWTPEDKWAQAFLKPGYKELVLISQQLKCP
jgi:cell division protein FtsL